MSQTQMGARGHAPTVIVSGPEPVKPPLTVRDLRTVFEGAPPDMPVALDGAGPVREVRMTADGKLTIVGWL